MVNDNRRKMRKVHMMTTSVMAAGLASVIFILLSWGMPALAADSQTQSDSQGSYGEKQKITTAGEARKALKKYFADKDVIIGEVVEKEFYFEADVMDERKTVVDKVIVDKRTGRVRSIY